MDDLSTVVYRRATLYRFNVQLPATPYQINLYESLEIEVL